MGSGESSQPAGSGELFVSSVELKLFVLVEVPTGSASSFCFCRAALLLLCRLFNVSVMVRRGTPLLEALEALAAASIGRNVGMVMTLVILSCEY